MVSHTQPPKTTVTYALFLHREELRRRKARVLQLSETKIYLTDWLITKVMQNINGCTAEDLLVLSRETIFKKKLKQRMHRIKKMQRKWMMMRRCPDMAGL